MLGRAKVPLDYLLERDLKEELASAENVVTRGSLSDFAEYRYQQGKICGIQMAINLLVQARERAGLEGDLND